MEFTDIRVLENPPSVAALTGPARKLCWSFCFLALLERLLMQLPSPKSINRRRERLVSTYAIGSGWDLQPNL
jgi:hypothetical protein